MAKLACVGATQDVLHIGRVDGFCLVSSDSDFTRLATRSREAGLVVYGFGERKTPEPFVAACDKFIYTEILRTEPEEAKPGKEPLAELPTLKPMILNALNAIAREDDWSTLSAPQFLLHLVLQFSVACPVYTSYQAPRSWTCSSVPISHILGCCKTLPTNALSCAMRFVQSSGV